MPELTLSVLDQFPISAGGDGAQAIAETLAWPAIVAAWVSTAIGWLNFMARRHWQAAARKY